MKEDDMRVSDLIPRKHPHEPESARDERDPVAVLQTNINRAVADFLRPLNLPFAGWPAPFLDGDSGIQVDVTETDKEVKVTAELPGLNESDVDVRLDDGMLVIGGEKKADREVNEKGYILRERSVGKVERSVPLPNGIDASAAQATFKSGVLTVTIPKTADARNGAKRIPVRPD
jgi:HSP20 family protein